MHHMMYNSEELTGVPNLLIQQSKKRVILKKREIWDGDGTDAMYKSHAEVKSKITNKSILYTKEGW
jgi:hypothetical protein